jgi:cytochrome c556
MIWALLFVALFSVFKGDSPFLIPKINKYVKMNVEDEERKEKLLVLIKEAKKERKVYAKEYNKQSKELGRLTKNRKTTKEEFEAFIKKSMQLRETSQALYQKLNSEAEKLVTKGEWENMKPHVQEDLKKLATKTNKSVANLEKAFGKLRNKIIKTIEDEHKRQYCIEAVSEYQTLLEKNFKALSEEVTNENSILYQYEVTESETQELQASIKTSIELLLRAQAKLHATLVKNTTETEWKKIKNKF